MFTKILNDKEVELFSNLIGVKVQKVFISKNGKYYYAILLEVEREVKVRISEKLANNFI